MALNIDLSDQTGGGSDVFSSGGSNNNSPSKDKKEDIKKSSDNDSWKNTDSVFTRNRDNDKSSNNKSSNIDLSDRTGNNYFTKNDDNDNDNKSSNKINLMKDHTQNGYDPSTTSSKEELQNIIDKRYPKADKTDNYGTSTKDTDNYSFMDNYNYIDYQKAKEEHRLETADIKQITEEYRQKKSAQDILLERHQNPNSVGEVFKSYRSQIKNNQYVKKDISFTEGLFSTIGSFFKGGLFSFAGGGDPGAGATSSAINTVLNYGFSAFDRQESDWYKENKNKIVDDRFSYTVEDFANAPSGPSQYNTSTGSTNSNSNNFERTGSSKSFTGSNDYQTVNQERSSQTGSNTSSEIADLITWFALNDSQQSSGSKQSSGSQGSSGGTTNIITASGEEKEESTNFKKYLPVGLGILTVLGLFFLGGE